VRTEIRRSSQYMSSVCDALPHQGRLYHLERIIYS